MLSKFSILNLSIALLMLVLAVLSLDIGAESIDLAAALGQVFSGNSIDAIILREVRIPRTLIAITAGATLGLCGAAMQGLFRNPLASPGLVGSSLTDRFLCHGACHCSGLVASAWHRPKTGCTYLRRTGSTEFRGKCIRSSLAGSDSRVISRRCMRCNHRHDRVYWLSCASPTSSFGWL